MSAWPDPDPLPHRASAGGAARPSRTGDDELGNPGGREFNDEIVLRREREEFTGCLHTGRPQHASAVVPGVAGEQLRTDALEELGDLDHLRRLALWFSQLSRTPPIRSGRGRLGRRGCGRLGAGAAGRNRLRTARSPSASRPRARASARLRLPTRIPTISCGRPGEDQVGRIGLAGPAAHRAAAGLKGQCLAAGPQHQRDRRLAGLVVGEVQPGGSSEPVNPEFILGSRLGEQVGGDAGQPVVQVGIAHRAAGQQLADDQEVPAVRDMLASRADNQPAPGRSPHLRSMILFPAGEPPPPRPPGG